MNHLDELFEYAREKGWNPRRGEPMCAHTTFKIGGPADLFMEISTEEDLCKAVKRCTKWGIPCRVIGKGSNLLVSDKGIRGTVILLSGAFCEVRALGEGKIECGAGASLARLCSFALSEELSGLEFAWGIPGSAGGAAFMNAGAYGGEMKDVLVSCRHVTPDGRIGTLLGGAIDLRYRHSAYTDNGCFITFLTVQLVPDSPLEIRARMEDFMRRRRDKQPLEHPSAGSVFKRPPGQFAGTLIEQSGLKGYAVGGAQVSEKHAGFIINTGQATCRDVETLIEHIQKKVRDDTGVLLECEVKSV